MIVMSERIGDWKAITPEILIAPVEHIREMFEEGVWKCSRVTEKLCFADLHRGKSHAELDSYHSAFATYRLIIGPAAAERFDKDHKLETLAAIFHAYLQAFLAGIDSEIRRLFDDLLQIGIVHSAKLAEHPVKWATMHLDILIADQLHVVRQWIKAVCDERDYSAPLSTQQEFKDFTFWKDWRAPKLIYMQPSGNLAYDPSTAWSREDEAKTKEVLDGLSKRFVQFLSIHLDKIAGNAHVELAKTGEVVREQGRTGIQSGNGRGGRGSDSDDDRRFALMAIEEARKSVPEDESPRPRVGAVVVKDGKVLSKAHRGESPKCHAEYIALENKLPDDLIAGATVYTTLEPCTTRKHPKIPCAQRLIDRKVTRVVMGMLDPNPDIRGLGDLFLSDAGIETQLFPRDLRAQVEELNREFIRAQKDKQRKQMPSQGADHAATVAARALTDAMWDLQKATWAFHSLHTQYGIARLAREVADEEKEIFKKIDAAFTVFSRDYDIPPDLSAIATREMELINIALVNLKAFSMTTQRGEMEIAATQVQEACERVRVAARPYAYRPSA